MKSPQTLLQHWKTSLGLLACLALMSSLPVSGSTPQPRPTPKPAPPEGPLLGSPSKFQQWVITFSYPQDQPQDKDQKQPLPVLDPALDRHVVTTKTGDIVHEESISVGGTKHDKWNIGRLFYVKPNGQTYWGECDENFTKNNSTPHPHLSPIPSGGFYDLDWINTDTFAGILKQGDQTCLVFLPAAAKNADISTLLKIQELSTAACVDATTRLPVFVKQDGVIRNYTFTSIPEKMQPLPADLTAQIKETQAHKAKYYGGSKGE